MIKLWSKNGSEMNKNILNFPFSFFFFLQCAFKPSFIYYYKSKYSFECKSSLCVYDLNGPQISI